jgi:hypothetical protein
MEEYIEYIKSLTDDGLYKEMRKQFSEIILNHDKCHALWEQNDELYRKAWHDVGMD